MPSASGRRVVVVGGGLAGIAAALDAADAGATVTLVERRRRLGGRTWSFHRHGLVMDNGQHVFMRCCTEYRAFVERIGGGEMIAMQRRLEVPVLAPGQPPSRIARVGLPAPAHLAPSLAAYRHLRPRAKVSAVRTALRLGRVDPAAAATDEIAFGDWLADHGQGEQAVAALWDLIGRPTMNVVARDASLALAAKVFRTGLLESAGGADIGWPLVPLSTLHDELPSGALDAAGVEVVTGAPVQSVVRAGSGFGVHGDGGRRWDADAVVVALPHQAVASVLPDGALTPGVEPARLGASPIVNVHLVYDRRVTDLPFAAAIGSPVQFLFDRTTTAGLRGPGQYLAISLSAADAEVDQKASAIVAGMTEAVAALLPKAERAQLVDAMVSRERAATFRGGPGTAAHRPAAETAIPGLVLAGAWTATGWPDTMEGAVRSGRAAAHAALGATITHVAGERGMTATAPAILGRTRHAIQPAMQSAVGRLAPRLRRPVEYHLGWLDLDGRPVENDGGKSVRAGLALLSAAAAGADEEVGVPGAVAIELVHNFSLIHDDLMDDDRERRHRPTVWAVFGPATAIIAGDALAALAVQVVLDAPGEPPRRAVEALQDATARMIAGQADDLALEVEPDVTIGACLAMAAGKTGALMSCAAALGAILADAPPGQVRALGDFGAQLGLAFQAVDDILGIWGEPVVTGKPAGNDIRRAKKSIPIVAALEHDDSGELRGLLADPDLDDASVARAADLIDRLGGRAFTEDIASSSLAAAFASLERSRAVPAVVAELEHVARFVVGRDR